MNHKKINYFSDMGMISFLKQHLEISEGAKMITNSLLTHAVQNYVAQVSALSKVILVPKNLNLAQCRWNIVNAYKICRLGVKSLARYNSSKHKELVSTLVEAFDDAVWGYRVVEVKATIVNAVRIASAIPMEKLKEVAMDERVATLLREYNQYVQCRKALDNNTSKKNSTEYAVSRKNCLVAYRCLFEQVENLSKIGDPDSKKFMAWLRAL